MVKGVAGIAPRDQFAALPMPINLAHGATYLVDGRPSEPNFFVQALKPLFDPQRLNILRNSISPAWNQVIVNDVALVVDGARRFLADQSLPFQRIRFVMLGKVGKSQLCGG
jgi:hypothetical protein